MAQRDRTAIVKALLTKGFDHHPGSDHDKYFFILDGKKTSTFTKISRGSNYKTYSDSLLDKMKKQLHLSLSDLLSFIDCPLSAEDYSKLMNEKIMRCSNK